MAIVVAFAIGMIATSSLASANMDVCNQPSAEKSQKSVWHALCDLQQQIDAIELTPGPPGEPGIVDIELVEFLAVRLTLGENNIEFSCPSPEQTAMAYGSTFAVRSAVPAGDNGWTLEFLCTQAGGCSADIWLKCL